MIDFISFSDFPELNGSTALYISTVLKHRPIVEFLLKSGASLDKGNRNQYTPLLVALHNNNYDLAHLFINFGADVNINRPNTFGHQSSLLTYVLFAKGHWDMAKTLVKAGMRPTKFITPLGFILLDDPKLELDVVKLLIEAGFNLYVDGWVEQQESRGDSNISEKQVSTIHIYISYELPVHLCVTALKRQNRWTDGFHITHNSVIMIQCIWDNRLFKRARIVGQVWHIRQQSFISWGTQVHQFNRETDIQYLRSTE